MKRIRGKIKALSLRRLRWPDRAHRWLSWCSAVAIPVALLTTQNGLWNFLGIALTAFAFVLLGAIGWARIRNFAGDRDAWSVDVDTHRILLTTEERRLKVQWKDIVSGRVNGARVSIVTADGQAIDFETTAEGMDELFRFGPHRRSHVLPLSIGEDRIPILWGFALATTFAATSFPIVGFLAATAFSVLFLLTNVGAKVAVGRDGVTVYRSPWSKGRYIGFRDVEEVVVLRSGVHFKMKGGRTESVAVLFVKASRLLIQTIEEAFAASEKWAARAQTIPGLSVDGLADKELAGALSRVTASDYRSAAIDPELLKNIVESPAADPVHRVAAAIALKNQGGKEAIVDALASTAHPKVRVALEKVTEESTSAAYVEALASVKSLSKTG